VKAILAVAVVAITLAIFAFWVQVTLMGHVAPGPLTSQEQEAATLPSPTMQCVHPNSPITRQLCDDLATAEARFSGS
jgi:hypothetical protein